LQAKDPHLFPRMVDLDLASRFREIASQQKRTPSSIVDNLMQRFVETEGRLLTMVGAYSSTMQVDVADGLIQVGRTLDMARRDGAKSVKVDVLWADHLQRPRRQTDHVHFPEESKPAPNGSLKKRRRGSRDHIYGLKSCRGLELLLEHRTEFEAFFGKPDKNGCRRWLGTDRVSGDDAFLIRDEQDGRTYFYYPRRTAFLLYHGELPDFHKVLQTCHNSFTCTSESCLYLMRGGSAKGCKLPVISESEPVEQQTIETESYFQVESCVISPELMGGLAPEEHALMQLVLERREKIEAKIRKDPGPYGCWHWLGKSGGEGRPRYALDSNKHLSAAYILWLLERGWIAQGTPLYRTCSSADCIRPEHRVKSPVRNRPRKKSTAIALRAQLLGVDLDACPQVSVPTDTSEAVMSVAAEVPVERVRRRRRITPSVETVLPTEQAALVQVVEPVIEEAALVPAVAAETTMRSGWVARVCQRLGWRR
jgi:hypothetical protein